MIPMDNLTPLVSERFELLSAYLDGEVSAAERQQVEAWLATDVELQRVYQQMLTLQNGLRSMPVAVSVLPTEQLVERVMQRVDQPARLWIWGGLGAAAALAVSAFSGLLTDNQNGLLQMAKQPTPPHPSTVITTVPNPASVHLGNGVASEAKTLMIALERPPVTIPVVSEEGTSSAFPPTH
jgi:anti-sigma factor RsiW